MRRRVTQTAALERTKRRRQAVYRTTAATARDRSGDYTAKVNGSLEMRASVRSTSDFQLAA
jgi:hypothetical protein